MKVNVMQVDQSDPSRPVSFWTIQVEAESDIDSVMERIEKAIGVRWIDLVSISLTTTSDISDLHTLDKPPHSEAG